MVDIQHFGSITAEPLKGKDVLPVLEAGCKILKDVPHWLSAGTMLGLYRDDGFIPHDTDLDVGAIGELPEEVKQEFPKQGFKLIRIMKSELGTMQTAYMHEATTIIFDIYHFYKGKIDDQDILINHNEFGTMMKPYELFNPIGEYTYHDVKFNAPNDIEKYLRIRYGDWKTPRHSKDSWNKDAANLEK